MIYKILMALKPEIKLFPIQAEQAMDLPFATYQVIDRKPIDDLEETNGFKCRVQINVYAKTYVELCTLCKQFYDNYQRKSGFRFIDERDVGEEEADKTAYGRQMDFYLTV